MTTATGPADRTVVVAAVDPAADEPRRRPGSLRPRADRFFRGAARGSGLTVLALMTMIGLFLAFRAQRALRADGAKFVTTQAWDPDSGSFGMAGVLTGSVLIALTAIAFALPLALGVALYISEYAPDRAKRVLVSLVDLMAAVPSVVFGLWDFLWFQKHSVGTTRWISTGRQPAGQQVDLHRRRWPARYCSTAATSTTRAAA